MPTSTLEVVQVMNYIRNELNVLAVGPSGLGKTHVLNEAAENLGLRIKYLNAPTIDAYAHLIGIPLPDEEKNSLKFFRPESFENADVLFIDEFNRGSDDTVNALYEIIQFRSINGIKLPNLKCVVAAMNPPGDEGYQVEELDIAIIDRFDIYIDLEPFISRPYFTKTFGHKVGAAAVKLWSDYEADRKRRRSSSNPIAYLSPRKMERITKNYIAMRNRNTIAASIPPGVTLTPRSVETALSEALKESSTTTAKKVATPTSNRASQGKNATAIRRSASSAKQIMGEDPDDEMKDSVAEALSRGISANRLSDEGWIDVLEILGRSRCRSLSSGWGTAKKHDLIEKYNAKSAAAGARAVDLFF